MGYYINMKRKLLYLIGFTIIVCLGALIYMNLPYKKAEVLINGTSFDVEIAKTAWQKIKGLSYREALAENAGMLFVFSSAQQRAFWMNKMNFSIDIIWIKDKKIIGIEKNCLSPKEANGKILKFKSPDSADMVLEIKAGKAEELGIEVGDELTIDF